MLTTLSPDSHSTLVFITYIGRQYCIAKFRTVYIDGEFFYCYYYCFMCKPSQSVKQTKLNKQNIENT